MIVSSSSACQLLRTTGERRQSDKERFVNARAEDFWNLRQVFENGEIDIDPDDDKFAAQLGSIKWGVDSRGRIKIESKTTCESEVFGHRTGRIPQQCSRAAPMADRSTWRVMPAKASREDLMPRPVIAQTGRWNKIGSLQEEFGSTRLGDGLRTLRLLRLSPASTGRGRGRVAGARWDRRGCSAITLCPSSGSRKSTAHGRRLHAARYRADRPASRR